MLNRKNVFAVVLFLLVSLICTSFIFSFVFTIDKVTYKNSFPITYFSICWIAIFGCFSTIWIDHKTRWSL